MSIVKGKMGLETTIMLTFIGVPVGFGFYTLSGYANIIGYAIGGFAVLVYAFILSLMSVKLPEKHRNAVAGKNFLEMEIYRNKEESDTFLFGVAGNEELQTSDTEAKVIEEDPKYVEIKQSCILESEKALLEYELERREQKTIIEDANLETLEDTVETEPAEAHRQIQDMENKIIDEMNKYVNEEMEKIQAAMKKMGETVESLKSKQDSMTDEQSRMVDEMHRLETLRPTYTVADKNMTEMSIGEIQFRLTTLDECEQSMAKLSYDDMIHALQYRMFQVRRIFATLFSTDIHVEMIRNYQPVTYFNTGRSFEQFVLVMRRVYDGEFTFKQKIIDHENYPVNVQCANCVAVTAGWVNSQIPIFLVIHSPADAHKKIDIVQSAKDLKDLKERILARLVNWYKMEYEQADYALEEERALSNMFILKYDELKQKLEEMDYKPEEAEKIQEKVYIKVVPGAMKAYAAIVTILLVIFIVTTVFLSGALKSGALI